MSDDRLYGGHGELLANIALFESLTADDLAALSQRVEEVEYQQGEVIFRQGDEGSSLFVIEDGAVEISYGEGKARVVLTSLFAGQYFGELSLLTRFPRNATVEASTEMELLVLGQREFSGLLDEVPGMAHKVLASMAERLYEADAKSATH